MPQIRRREPRKVETPLETIAEEHPPLPEEPPEPRVSAILVGFNQVEILRRAVRALEASENRDRLEILVVDCGSKDESAQIDTEFQGVTVLRMPHHFGATKAMNIATRTAKGEFIFYLSPNVEVAPDTITKLADKLGPDEETSAVCPLLVDPRGGVVTLIRGIPTRSMFAEACRGEMPGEEVDTTAESVEQEYPGIDAVMVRKQVIKGLNYFDERYGNTWADADMAMKIWRGEKKIKLYPGIRVTWHDEPNPLEGDPLLKADSILGASVYVGKYYGFLSGGMFRMGAIFRALGHFDIGLLSRLLSGQKLDGSQAS